MLPVRIDSNCAQPRPAANPKQTPAAMAAKPYWMN
jgi:hypothetical protein